jgi:hypothetical protein
MPSDSVANFSIPRSMPIEFSADNSFFSGDFSSFSYTMEQKYSPASFVIMIWLISLISFSLSFEPLKYIPS